MPCRERGAEHDEDDDRDGAEAEPQRIEPHSEVRLDAAGAPIASFGSAGIVNANPFDNGDAAHGFAEAYAVTVIPQNGGG